ncbi:hypothetical protein [Vallicoccus soli]|uniref:Uncharacterized protein n=1 Tax=Vallicoccus soli TaxID=2339232 RepID=A0A3A3YZJ1_9ACTN|nr:hypothetical protein [Vallicoccus soli]RJK96303.1 hypothetical protein D5H78_08605 [Vallicoccus soli]
MTTALLQVPTAHWQPADPWVAAGVCRLGELLVAHGLVEANPASNTGAAYDGGTFLLAPGLFACDEVQVRWGRHAGSAAVQDREVGREAWAELLRRCRASVTAARAA